MSLFFLCARAEGNGSITSLGRQVLPQLPRSSQTLSDIVGLDDAKAVLREAVVLPLKIADDLASLFWRSSEHSAVLLAGPEGLGKRAAAEAAGAAVDGQVLNLLASEAREIQFCRIAMSAASESERPLVIIVEALETAPEVTLSIRNCLREVASAEGKAPKIAIVATANADPARFLRPHELALFGYFLQLWPPSQAERKQFLLKLFAEVSRLDAHWGSALRESAVETLANISDQYTFTEIDFVVRRAFLRSSGEEGAARDPVALHHFEKILAETPPRSMRAFKAGIPCRPVALSGATGSSEADVVVEPAVATSGQEPEGQGDAKSTKKKNSKDPMESIFGWCNFWLPEQLHLPPVVWAMIVFGILAHLMARTTYQPYSHRRRRGGPAGRGGSLFGDMGDVGGMGGMGSMGGMGEGNPYSSFGDQVGGDWPLGGSGFPPAPGVPGFPSAPGVPGLGTRGDASGMFSSGSAEGAGTGGGSSDSSASAPAAKDQ